MTVETLPDATERDSAIYRGFVRHRRFTPRNHEFRYPIHMVFLNLAELPLLKNELPIFGSRWFHWARFLRSDYVGPRDIPLTQAVRHKLAEKLDRSMEDVAGEVFFFGHLRYGGFYFSPLNLYFLRKEGRMRYMLAEVSNTPWNERHYYAIDLDILEPHAKEFHVSPFNSMSQSYQWKIRVPHQQDTKAMIHLDVSDTGTATRVFDATMVLKRVPLNRQQLFNVMLSTPVQTLTMVLGIYWQALKLYLKGVPLHRHPKRTATEPNDTGSKYNSIVNQKDNQLESKHGA